MEKPWGHIAKLSHLIVLGHRACFMIKFVLAALQLVKFDVQSVTNERPCPSRSALSTRRRATISNR